MWEGNQQGNHPYYKPIFFSPDESVLFSKAEVLFHLAQKIQNATVQSRGPSYLPYLHAFLRSFSLRTFGNAQDSYPGQQQREEKIAKGITFWRKGSVKMKSPHLATTTATQKRISTVN